MILAAAIVFKELIQISISWPKYWLFTAKIGLLIFMVFLITINVRFRILDATTANPVVAKSACFVRGLTPLLYNKFDDYCGTG